VYCGSDRGACIGNVLEEEREALRERQRAFRRKALRGECAGKCSMKIGSSGA